MPRKILFFIESLCSGGKERRFTELLCYLKQNTNYRMQIVLMSNEIHYSYVRDLNIPVVVLKRKGLKKDPRIFYKFYKVAKKFNPDIIHTWSIMTTFYAIPAKLLLKRPVVANLISNAKMKFKKWSLINLCLKICCAQSKKVLSNSFAGLKAYNINSEKSCVIYNGVRLERFKQEPEREKTKKEIGIKTRFAVIMVASFSANKNYDFFLDVAKEMQRRNKEVTFIGVGGGTLLPDIKKRVRAEKIKNVLLVGEQKHVEKLISVTDISVLFTNCKYHREGISNSIIEYMALAKPVITTDVYGGSSEIIEDGVSGYIVNEDIPQLIQKICELLRNEPLRKKMGKRGNEIIKSEFSIGKMGASFLNIYNQALN